MSSTTATAAKSKGELAIDFRRLYAKMCGADQGWLIYHFGHLTPFGRYLLAALADCELRVPQLGYRFVKAARS